MTNAVNQGSSNTMAITDALQRTTTQFAVELKQTIQMGVDTQAEEIKNASLIKSKHLMAQTHLIVTLGWKRYMHFVPKQGDHSGKCYYYVPDKLSVISL